jgi:aspartate carbamoyltransferase catalytic subunit
MPQCATCGKKGLFLKIEEDSGLCLACNESFSKEGKTLTENIIAAKRNAMSAQDPETVSESCKELVRFGNDLLALHERYHIQPSQELLDLITTYEKMGKLAGK